MSYFSQLCVTAWANGSLLGVAQTVLSDGFQKQVLWGRVSSEPGGLRQRTGRAFCCSCRQMVITALADQASGQQVVHSVLEHPKDPLDCSLVPAAGRYKVLIHLFGLQKYMRKGPWP